MNIIIHHIFFTLFFELRKIFTSHDNTLPSPGYVVDDEKHDSIQPAYSALSKRDGFNPALLTVDDWTTQTLAKFKGVFPTSKDAVQDLNHQIKRITCSGNIACSLFAELGKRTALVYDLIDAASIKSVDAALLSGEITPGSRITVPEEGGGRRVVTVPKDGSFRGLTPEQIARMKADGIYWRTFVQNLRRLRCSLATIVLHLKQLWRWCWVNSTKAPVSAEARTTSSSTSTLLL